MKVEYLEFITFCVGSLADALNKSASQIYNALRSSGVLEDYIIPCYDVLHTFSKDYLVDELTEVLKRKREHLHEIVPRINSCNRKTRCLAFA